MSVPTVTFNLLKLSLGVRFGWLSFWRWSKVLLTCLNHTNPLIHAHLIYLMLHSVTPIKNEHISDRFYKLRNPTSNEIILRCIYFSQKQFNNSEIYFYILFACVPTYNLIVIYWYKNKNQLSWCQRLYKFALNRNKRKVKYDLIILKNIYIYKTSMQKHVNN